MALQSVLLAAMAAVNTTHIITEFAVSAHNQERNSGVVSCTEWEYEGPDSEALSREVTSRISDSLIASMFITIFIVPAT